jgi:F-type H+-transporting ATPase subunit b
MFRIRTWAFCLVLLLAGVSLAQAAGDAHYGWTEWRNLLWRLLTAALVAGVIWRFAGQKAVAFFRGRRSGIEKELRDFETRKEDARANLAAVEKRIADLEKERRAVLDDYKARGEALAAEIIAKAEARAELIGAQARQAARNEIDQAILAMRGELAEAIADAAREALAASLTPARHEKLIDACLAKVVIQ